MPPTGSEVPGVQVIDAGVDPRALSATLYRASGAAAEADAAADSFAAVYSALREDRYDVVHNHAFDAPAITLAADLPAPVVHTVHLPPDEAVAGALRQATDSDNPPTVAGVSESQASAWRANRPGRGDPSAPRAHRADRAGRPRAGTVQSSPAG